MSCHGNCCVLWTSYSCPGSTVIAYRKMVHSSWKTFACCHFWCNCNIVRLMCFKNGSSLSLLVAERCLGYRIYAYLPSLPCCLETSRITVNLSDCMNTNSVLLKNGPRSALSGNMFWKKSRFSWESLIAIVSLHSPVASGNLLHASACNQVVRWRFLSPRRNTCKHSWSPTWQFPCFVSSRRGDKFGRHTSYCSDVSVSQGGERDITVHITLQKHQNYLHAVEKQGNLRTVRFMSSVFSQIFLSSAIYRWVRVTTFDRCFGRCSPNATMQSGTATGRWKQLLSLKKW